MIDKNINVDWLKKNAKMIHYFGLGFVQLKVNDTFRLHFYNKSLPAIVSEEDIHNHRYDFRSKVIKGKFIQELFDVVEGDTHVREFESCQHGVEAPKDAVPCGVERKSRHLYTAGSMYDISHNTFHRVKANNCITLLMRKTAPDGGFYRKPYAEVVRKKDAEKVCPFSKKVSEDELWEIVAEMTRQ